MMKQNLSVAKKLLVLVAIVATILPMVYVFDRVGGVENWQGVPPQGITDSLYYYARMHEVADGHPFVGNPFVYEYRNTYSPAFFLPDAISALPLLIGLPWSAAITLNFFIWTAVFLFVTQALLKALRIDDRWIVPLTVLVYVSSYSFMLRPTIMQIIYPLFLFVLTTFLLFLYEPDSRKRSLWFAGASALTFYFYNYLAFVVCIMCAFLFAWYLARKQYRELRALIVMGIYTILFLIPFGIYSFLQMRGPLYEETLARIGLVHTHIPTLEAFFFGRWIGIALCAFLLILFFVARREGKYTERAVFWMISGVALFTGLFLNVITGVELTLAVHIGRIVVVWTALIFGVLLYEWYTGYFAGKKNAGIWAHLAIGFFVILLALGVARNLPRSLGFFHSDNRDVSYRELQEYAAPLSWLEEHVTEESVIWSNISIGSYIPVMTKHYTLFHNAAALHAIPQSELEERYLLWKSLEDIGLEDVKDDVGFYVGAGGEKEQPLTENNRAWVCHQLSRFMDRGECPQKTDAVTLHGEQYFEDLIHEYAVIKENRAVLLQKYSVGYLVVDAQRDTYVFPMSTSTAVYADGRFFIFPAGSIAP